MFKIMGSTYFFKEYADLTVGVGHMKYFNAGILLMNLKEMRKTNFFTIIMYLIIMDIRMCYLKIWNISL